LIEVDVTPRNESVSAAWVVDGNADDAAVVLVAAVTWFFDDPQAAVTKTKSKNKTKAGGAAPSERTFVMAFRLLVPRSGRIGPPTTPNQSGV
jgi:hypothetical protein